MHVAFVINNMSGGGAALSCINLIRMLLSRKSFSIDLILLEYKGSRLTQIPESVSLFVMDPKFDCKETLPCSIPYETIHYLKPSANLKTRFSRILAYCRSLHCSEGKRLKAKKRHLHWTAALTEYVERRQPDILYAQLNHAGVISVLCRRITSFKFSVIWAVRNNPELCLGDKAIHEYFINLIGDADKVHAISKGVASSLEKLCPTTKGKITIMHNSLNSDVWSLSSEQVSHPWLSSRQIGTNNIETDRNFKVILGAGSFNVQKDFSVLIHALKFVRLDFDARLIILGDGAHRNLLEETARDLNLSHVVSLPGWVSNPYAFMSKADVFVLSSKYEGFANVIVEALACGCPVVSTDCPYGPREILEDGKWGELVPVGNHTAMANAITTTFRQESRKDLLEHRARSFTHEGTSDQLVEMLNVTKRVS